LCRYVAVSCPAWLVRMMAFKEQINGRVGHHLSLTFLGFRV
jgi:hypothetical protein